jgi:hypothetical protein
VWLTNLPPSCADCQEILGTSKSWNPNAFPGLYRHRHIFSLFIELSTFSQSLATNDSPTPEISMYIFAPGTILTEIFPYFSCFLLASGWLVT